MAYLYCGRCGLQIKSHAAILRIESCPRCLARSAILAPLVLSADRVIPAAGWGPPSPVIRADWGDADARSDARSLTAADGPTRAAGDAATRAS